MLSGPRLVLLLAVLLAGAVVAAPLQAQSARVACQVLTPLGEVSDDDKAIVQGLFAEAERILETPPSGQPRIELVQFKPSTRACGRNLAAEYKYARRTMGEIEGFSGNFIFPAGDFFVLKHGTSRHGCVIAPYTFAVAVSAALFYSKVGAQSQVKRIKDVVNGQRERACRLFANTDAKNVWIKFRDTGQT